MRLLLPSYRDLTVDELVDLYDWPAEQWVRGLMAMTLDGAFVGPDGLSGSISGHGDQLVFSACRALSDVLLVGAGTVRAEGYRALRAKPEHAERRAERGQRPAPTLAVVSASCRFDWPNTSWVHSDERPVLLTVQAAEPGLRAAAATMGCDVAVVGDEVVDPAAALGALSDRGLTRVTCEGGPTLLGELVVADLLDELVLTLSPLLSHAEVPRSSGPTVLTRMRLALLAEDDGYLFTRYVRPEAPDLGGTGRR